MADDVQGDDEGGLHGEDGHAGDDGDVAPLHGPPFGQKRASQVLRRRDVILRLAVEG
jgi:hypothetical protein